MDNARAVLFLAIGVVGAIVLVVVMSFVAFPKDTTSMADTFSSYVEAINEGRYDEAISLVDGNCLDDLASVAPPEGGIEWEVLMAAEGEDAGVMAFKDNLTVDTSWQLMTKVDGDWKVACEAPW